MQIQGSMKAVIKRNSLGERSFLSWSMEQEPMLVSSPKRPQIPRHVGIMIENVITQMLTTISAR